MSNETKKSTLEEVTATAERQGCDRPGCTEPITVGQVVRRSSSTGKLFHETAECNGFQQAEVQAFGEQYINAVRKNLPLPVVPMTQPTGKRKGLVTPENFAKLTPEQQAKYLAELQNAAAVAKASGPVVSSGRRRG